MMHGAPFLAPEEDQFDQLIGALLGYLSALLFASVGQFQNRMVYDPVGLLNISIAAVFAVGGLPPGRRERPQPHQKYERRLREVLRAAFPSVTFSPGP